MLSKKSVVLMAVLSIFSYSHADVEDVMAELGKAAINAAKEVALKDRTKVDMTNVYMETKIDMENSGVFGNVGNSVTGDDITMNNVDMISEIDMRNSGVIGNVGNSVGK